MLSLYGFQFGFRIPVMNPCHYSRKESIRFLFKKPSFRYNFQIGVYTSGVRSWKEKRLQTEQFCNCTLVSFHFTNKRLTTWNRVFLEKVVVR
jgi:hypothetical protein